ncbi:hypothetical protein AMECASPLE_024571 [Ameca splendens]|uniref:Uncharacterized protein n=1 Tax=Ameca splendens TaxID=208324 RepID=A0ABV0XTI0_9TELE
MEMCSIHKSILTSRWGPYSSMQTIGLITFVHRLICANESHSLGGTLYSISEQHMNYANPCGWHGPAQERLYQICQSAPSKKLQLNGLQCSENLNWHQRLTVPTGFPL